MSYSTKQEAIDEIEKAALVIQDQKIIINQGNIQLIDVICLVENNDGSAQQVVQQVFVRSNDGITYLGKIQPFMRDYLAIKEELSSDDYNNMTAIEAEEAIKNKVVKKPLGSFITWRMIQDVIGFDRTLTIKSVIEQAANSNPQIKPMIDEINKLLDPANNMGVDPASNEFCNQVDAMRAIVTGAGQEFTEEEANKIKAIGETTWPIKNNITIRSHQVSAIIN